MHKSQRNISVKLVAEYGVGTIAAGVAKAKADLITIRDLRAARVQVPQALSNMQECRSSLAFR
jgi:hypothetical protein